MSPAQSALAERSAVAAAALPRRISILGATGSIGRNTLDLIRRNRASYRVVALTANRSVAELAALAREFRPEIVAIGETASYQDLKELLAGTGCEVAAGAEAVAEAAQRQADWVMAGILGAAGLQPTLSALRQGAVVALANKEALVCAGSLMAREMAAHNAVMLPVDSEHNAIFQVLDAKTPEAVRRIILTASGGPFRLLSLAEMAKVSPAQALSHPNWEMGAKISIDSATLMNKGLELIEAKHLFHLPEERLEVLVHPESVIHSLVDYVDGSVLAQLGQPDMRTPIAHTLAWPKRMATPVPPLDLAQIATLHFERPDDARFPALELCRQALRAGQAATTALNAANEIAVHAFLREEIGFLDIVAVVETVVAATGTSALESLDDVLALDREGRRAARDCLARRSGATLPVP
jgi:1-deoxy-D-xylulose-5-phosphate reductoisomerase